MLTKVLSIILAGGEGKRLYPLTKERAKPAVPFAGRFRIIDFTINNFINSGYYKIKVLTQFKADSLIRHLSRGWNLSPMLGHYIDPVPAQMRTGKDWYKGTADAIYQNLNLIIDENPRFVCVFAGDHIYKMDIKQMLVYHINKNADLTISVLPMPITEAKDYGVVEVDSDMRVIGFEEKPLNPKSIPGDPSRCLVSMGNYIFNKETIINELSEDAKSNSEHDIGKDIITRMYKQCVLYAYNFMDNNIDGLASREKGYWKDVGSIDVYWKAHMELVSANPPFDLYNDSWPFRTYYTPSPPAKFISNKDKSIGTNFLISEGCIVDNGYLSQSVLSPMVTVKPHSEIYESIIMEHVIINKNCRIKKTIIDKNIEIPEGTVIGYDMNEDKKRFHVTDNGIVVVTKGTNLTKN